MKPALTYDDIQLIPQYSEVESRSNISLVTKLSKNFEILIPYIASPMDTVCESEMAIEMMNLGGVGCIHRFMSIEDQVEEVQKVHLIKDTSNFLNNLWEERDIPIMAAVGANGDYLERAEELVKNGVNVILIDVAHGHHSMVKSAIYNIKNKFKVDVIAGNVATLKGAEDLIKWQADGIRVGIGGGSLCTTRIQTGHGVPNITSIIEAFTVADLYKVPVMADGGIRASGDIAKALAVGASNVMLGSLLAGTSETPGFIIEKNTNLGIQLFKRYRGSASLETKSAHGQATKNVEGESTVVPFKGKLKFTISRLNDGVRSALSYSGANSINEFQIKAEFNTVTNSGLVEGRPHLLT